MLETFGFDDQDEKVYCLSIAYPTWGPAQLARELGLRPQQVIECHEHLIDHGILKRHPTDPERVIALPPDAALDLLEAREDAGSGATRATHTGTREIECAR